MRAEAPARSPSRPVLGLLLFLTPLIWGLTFPGAKVALETLPLLPFMAWSRGLGFLAILAALPVVARGELGPGALREVAGPGLALGSLMFLGYWLQTWGLQLTTATNSGFITGLYVVMTPLLGLVLWRQRVPAAGWASAAVAVVGLALLDPGVLRARQPVHTKRPRDQPPPRLRQPEFRVLRSHNDVARQRHLQPATQRKPVHPGNDWLKQVEPVRNPAEPPLRP